MFENTDNRLLPAFLIIGGIKCSSSSFYRYICEHPKVLPCREKEPGFFSFHTLPRLQAGFEDYCKLFPKQDEVGELQFNWADLDAKDVVSQEIFAKNKQNGIDYISCEATASTYFKARPGAVKTVLPDAKLIMLVRNPSARFISHYRMLQRFCQEGRNIAPVPELSVFVDDEIRRFRKQENTRILHQGLYVSFLRKWKAVFGKERLLVLRSELFNKPDSAQQQMSQVTHFLNIAEHDFKDVLKQKFNQAKPYSPEQAVVEKLDEFYARANAQLKQEFDVALA
ncbi:sulfotransferase [Ningiella sp. W23]|uniref:sulfotransferase n=1 Tax=Ningiella sp. W23 TaxID=3023715 RepID=UPI0037584C93